MALNEASVRSTHENLRKKPSSSSHLPTEAPLSINQPFTPRFLALQTNNALEKEGKTKTTHFLEKPKVAKKVHFLE